MANLGVLFGKVHKTIKEEGIGQVIPKTKSYLSNRKEMKEFNINDPENTFADVLFINGCYLPHPSRYRVSHQREQLWSANISSNEVFYTDLTYDMVRMYRVFVFFRCPYTEVIGQVIRKAKQLNKVVLFDIDDLMIDKKYTKTIKHLDTMSKEELDGYYSGIELTQKTLKMCDAAITTTERLADELKNYIPEVYINRNVASDEMLMLSEKAYKESKYADEYVRLGYFSGSITHNADFDLILPTIIKIMEKYEYVRLVICGELDLPHKLAAYKDRIEMRPFCDWRQLPELIASVDINLAPLENSIFNEAKSENKWVEAALVRVPTVASKVGAFEKMISNNVDGFLCQSADEWEEILSKLIEEKDYRIKIGNKAYENCLENCTSVYASANIANIIQNVMKPNIVMILPVLQISGGALVILKHCELLHRAGYDVSIINQGNEKDKWIQKDGIEIPVIRYNRVAISATLDKAVATLWSTVSFFEIYSKIKKKYYNVQNFETDFYEAGHTFKIEANRTYNSTLDMKYITISKWCENWLISKYNKQVQYAPNGIYVDRFYPQKRDWANRKVRILVEGNSNDYYKNVDESFEIVDLLDKDKYEIWFMSYQGKPKEGYYVDKFMHKVPYEEVPNVYRQCDILIKSSILESFSYPPLEMMATGGYVVVAPNGGNVEFLRDRENCMFYEHQDLSTAVDAIEQICKDEKLRECLYENGISTARERDWESIKYEILSLYDVEK